MPLGSQRVTLRDIRAITQTVYECRDLWADPLAWQAHLMRRAASLGGFRIGLYFEMADHGGSAANRILAANDIGWESDGERHTVVEGLSQRPLRYSPLWAAFADVLASRTRTPAGLTMHQDRVIAAPTWQASEMYDRHVRPTRLGQATLSAVWLPHVQCWSAWSLVTDRGEIPLRTRSERVLRLLHQQIAPLVGTRLSTWRDRNVSTLSITRRRVLMGLLDGHTETEIAVRSSRSPAAVHEHVTAIYRHFNVRSRSQLAAFFLRQKPAPAGRSTDSSAPQKWLDRQWAEAPAGKPLHQD